MLRREMRISIKREPELLIKEESLPRTSAFLEVVDEPGDTRFRYRKEKFHGFLLGASCSGSKKKKDLCYPRVKLHNFEGEALILCWLITASSHNHQPHFHQLLQKKGSSNSREPISVRVNRHNNYTAVFERMHIAHSVMREEDLEIFKKKRAMFSFRNVEDAHFSTDCEIEEEVKGMDKNQAVLYFVAYNCKSQLFICETLSRKIKNLHSSVTGMLRICRVFQTHGSCKGGDEIVIFVEKVSKDVKIRFFEKNENSDEIIWSSMADFGTSDIHHQVAISFRTPAYRDAQLERSKTVYFQLYRNGEVSSPVRFTYTPAVARPTATDVQSEIEPFHLQPDGVVTDVGDVPVKTEIPDLDADESGPDYRDETKWERCLWQEAMRCHHCDFSSVSVGRLRKHIETEHRRTGLRLEDLPGKKCSDAEQVSKSAPAFRHHLGGRHHFSCISCPFRSLSHSERKRHFELKRHRIFRIHTTTENIISDNNVDKKAFQQPRVKPY